MIIGYLDPWGYTQGVFRDWGLADFEAFCQACSQFMGLLGFSIWALLWVQRALVRLIGHQGCRK